MTASRIATRGEPFKNLHASFFFAAAQQAKNDGNEALEDRFLTTNGAVIAASSNWPIFWSTSLSGPGLCGPHN
jgi:hypothetical protein